MSIVRVTRSWWQNPIFGWLASCATGALVVTIVFFNKRFIAVHPTLPIEVFGWFAAYSLVPVFIAVFICERYALRNPLWYLLYGSIGIVAVLFLITRSTPMSMRPPPLEVLQRVGLHLTATGAAMGIAYWLISGRRSGIPFNQNSHKSRSK